MLMPKPKPIEIHIGVDDIEGRTELCYSIHFGDDILCFSPAEMRMLYEALKTFNL